MQYGDLQLVHAVQETLTHLGVGFLAFGGKAEIGGLFDLNDEDGRGVGADGWGGDGGNQSRHLRGH